MPEGEVAEVFPAAQGVEEECRHRETSVMATLLVLEEVVMIAGVVLGMGLHRLLVAAPAVLPPPKAPHEEGILIMAHHHLRIVPVLQLDRVMARAMTNHATEKNQ